MTETDYGISESCLSIVLTFVEIICSQQVTKTISILYCDIVRKYNMWM